MSTALAANTSPIIAPTELPPSEHVELHLPSSTAAPPAPAKRADTGVPRSVYNLAPPELPSQPITATASPSPQATSQGDDEDESSEAAPYGTRSRNRNGGARPNYADDKELDMEIEAAGRYTKATTKKPNQPAAHTPTSAARDESTTATRHGFTTINGTTVAANGVSGMKEPIPGTSSFSAHSTPPAASSKKRKQPGSNTTLSHLASTTATTMLSKSRAATAALHKPQPETNMMSFDKCRKQLNAKGQLVADDGTTLAPNDHVYMVCEPPGEPYYLGRIMEFLAANNEPGAQIDSVRVNWYYRPKDILRRVQDTRVVFASMHSDTCPLTAFRGKCIILHLSEIPDLDQFRIQKDSFWFDKLYDRYMLRYYEVIPTGKVINVPQHVKTVLDERWRFVLVEIGRGKELTSAVKTCKKCSLYAANHDSVDCAECKNTYHMACMRPPLLKKPARGFAWACAACTRQQERKLEARNTPIIAAGAAATDGAATAAAAAAGAEHEPVDDEEEEGAQRSQTTRESSSMPEPHPPPTAEQIAQANLWPFRYLGLHCRVEDALDYDDRIYPRASSRLGPRHQANVNVWHGRPVELVKPADIKKKYVKSASHKKEGKLSKETLVALEVDRDSKLKRPKWVLDEPFGYIARGEDTPIEIKGKKEFTSKLTFKMPDPEKCTARGGDDHPRPEDAEKLVDDYMLRVKLIAPEYNIPDWSTDFLTKAVEKLQENDYDIEKALTAMRHLHLRSDLKQPELNREEVKRFEEGIAKWGSELGTVSRHVSTSTSASSIVSVHGRVVRFYYMWKKTDRGRQIWGNVEGRKSKKESKRAEKDGASTTKLLDDVADDQDDSAFDDEKAAQKKRGFECKFCNTRSSRQWRRAPGTPPGTLVPADASAKNSKDKSTWLTLALCGKCAYLWRRYGIQYESIEEVSKKIAAAGGRASKRRIDEELMRTIVEAQHESGDTISTSTAAVAASAGIEVPATLVQSLEPPRKKAKAEKDSQSNTPDLVVEKKKIVYEKPAEPPPPVGDQPRVKLHPCAICFIVELPGDALLRCQACRLSAHKSCYGVSPTANTKPWYCDTCKNDHSMQVSTTYECVLCPIKHVARDLFEPPRVTHKKKTDREREKERLDKENIAAATTLFLQDQEANGWPTQTREPLKRTAWNNWVHVTCALWTKEIKFGRADLFDEAEGIGFIPPDRYEACSVCRESKFPTVRCQFPSCPKYFHVGCAHQNECLLGFDVTPVKGTRRDAVTCIKLGEETGVATAAIWCPQHTTGSTIRHNMLEATEEGLTAMQLFARTYKQVDQSLTGTVRRAAQFAQLPPPPGGVGTLAHRRASTTNGVTAAANLHIDRVRTSPAPSPPISPVELLDEPDSYLATKPRAGGKKCYYCKTTFSPKWWPTQRAKKPRANGVPPPPTGPSGEPTRNAESESINGGSFKPSQSGGLSGNHPLSELAPKADHPMVNGVVEHEPAPPVKSEDDESPRNEEPVFQCHKCHVQKRSSPPPSPALSTQPEPVTRRSQELAQVDSSQPPSQFYPGPRYSEYHNVHPAFPSSAHGHPPPPPPPSNLGHWEQPPPSPSRYAPPPAPNWGPPHTNGYPPPPSHVPLTHPYPYAHASPYYPHSGAPYPSPHYGPPPAQPAPLPQVNGYQPHRSPQAANGVYPPPPPPPPPPPNPYPPAQHSYGQPIETPAAVSPQMHTGPHRGYAPPPPPLSAPAEHRPQGHSRQQSMESPQIHHSNPPPPPAHRPAYQQSLPSEPMTFATPRSPAQRQPSYAPLPPRAESAYAPLPQSATDSSGGFHPPPSPASQQHFRPPSRPMPDIASTGEPGSGTSAQRTMTPADSRDDRDRERDRERERATFHPGASASPNLRNLLL